MHRRTRQASDGNSKGFSVTVDTEGKSRQSSINTGEVELLEFLAQRRACDDRDREIVCSDVRALARGIRNALLAVLPLWLALALRVARGTPYQTLHSFYFSQTNRNSLQTTNDLSLE